MQTLKEVIAEQSRFLLDVDIDATFSRLHILISNTLKKKTCFPY